MSRTKEVKPMNYLPTKQDMQYIRLVINQALPPTSLLLVGEKLDLKTPLGISGMIGIIDLSGEFDSWVYKDAVILEIHGTETALELLKERVQHEG